MVQEGHSCHLDQVILVDLLLQIGQVLLLVRVARLDLERSKRLYVFQCHILISQYNIMNIRVYFIFSAVKMHNSMQFGVMYAVHEHRSVAKGGRQGGALPLPNLISAPLLCPQNFCCL